MTNRNIGRFWNGLGAISQKINYVGTIKLHQYVEGNTTFSLKHNGKMKLIEKTKPSPAEYKRQLLAEATRATERHREKTIRCIIIALRDPIAFRIMELLGTSSPGGRGLGHIVDLIQDANNGNLSRLASGAQLERIYRSINHPNFVGNRARHALSSHVAPSNPM